jgi:hypothetical protein
MCSVARQMAVALAVSSFAVGNVYAGGGGGGGGGGAKMQIATTHGMNVIEHPDVGQASMTGFVQAALAGDHTTPSDTIVTLNGVRLVHVPGLAPAWFQVDPAGVQPVVGADGFLHITASSVSANTTRTLNLPCPAHMPVTTTPVEDSSLSGVDAVTLAWPFPLVQNAASVLTFFDPASVTLASYDLVSGTVTGGISFVSLPQTAMSATVPVGPTNSTGYVVKFNYPGQYVLDGNSGGVCAVEERFLFSR